MSFYKESTFKARSYHDQNKNQFLHNKIKVNNMDQSQSTLPKHTDTAQTKQLKNKITLIMNKFATVKKQKQQLAKQNKSLQEQLITMQSNLRQMIPGFSNTSSNFPIHNQLVVKIAQFYKYDCLDKFFDLLCPELSMKGIIYFYATCFNKLNGVINNYMNPALNSLMKIGCFNTLQGPIMNVLRKSFQVNQQKINKQIFNKQNLNSIIHQMQSSINLKDSNSQANQQILQFLLRLGEIMLNCYISDPPLSIDAASIGKKVYFNPLKHDPFDGFIKPKQQCWIILPQVRRGLQNGQMVTKSLVLHTNYDISN